MTPEQIKLVRLSMVKLLDHKVEIGQVFYDRLFLIAPEVQPLFKGDIKVQGRKLMDTIGVAVSSLRDPAVLQSTLQDLGRRHTAYGVKDEHYDKVAEALLWTLGKILGEDFTPPVKDAWTSLYVSVADTMRAAAKGDAGARQSA